MTYLVEDREMVWKFSIKTNKTCKPGEDYDHIFLNAYRQESLWRKLNRIFYKKVEGKGEAIENRAIRRKMV